MSSESRLSRLLGALTVLFVILGAVVGGAVPAAAQNAVGASTLVMINSVGSSTDIGAGQRLGKTVLQPGFVVATGVAAEGAGARFIVGAGGGTLDAAAVTIPKAKFGYLLENPSKAGVFRDSMGFDQGGLDQALRSHLIDNFGSASRAVPMVGGGSKFSVRGAMTGPSGATWDITSVWGVDLNGTVRLITATP